MTDIIAFYDASIDTVHCINFYDHGNYRHCTVATNNLHAEPDLFDVHEYHDYLDVVDDILDAYSRCGKSNL
jgi:hypothetical protein